MESKMQYVLEITFQNKVDNHKPRLPHFIDDGILYNYNSLRSCMSEFQAVVLDNLNRKHEISNLMAIRLFKNKEVVFRVIPVNVEGRKVMMLDFFNDKMKQEFEKDARFSFDSMGRNSKILDHYIIGRQVADDSFIFSPRLENMFAEYPYQPTGYRAVTNNIGIIKHQHEDLTLNYEFNRQIITHHRTLDKAISRVFSIPLTHYDPKVNQEFRGYSSASVETLEGKSLMSFGFNKIFGRKNDHALEIRLDKALVNSFIQNSLDCSSLVEIHGRNKNIKAVIAEYDPEKWTFVPNKVYSDFKSKNLSLIDPSISAPYEYAARLEYQPGVANGINKVAECQLFEDLLEAMERIKVNGWLDKIRSLDNINQPGDASQIVIYNPSTGNEIATIKKDHATEMKQNSEILITVDKDYATKVVKHFFKPGSPLNAKEGDNGKLLFSFPNDALMEAKPRIIREDRSKGMRP